MRVPQVNGGTIKSLALRGDACAQSVIAQNVPDHDRGGLPAFQAQAAGTRCTALRNASGSSRQARTRAVVRGAQLARAYTGACSSWVV